MPRACAEVMQALALRRQWMGHCELHVSYIAVFGEEVLLGLAETQLWTATAAVRRAARIQGPRVRETKP